MDLQELQDAVGRMSFTNPGPTDEGSAEGASGYSDDSQGDSNNYVFVDNIGTMTIYFSVICAPKYSFVWIGNRAGTLTSLSLSMPTPYDRGAPVSTRILGAADHSQSGNLASKLAKKTNQPFYVSYNLPDTDPRLAQQVDQRLFEELNKRPEKFCAASV